MLRICQDSHDPGEKIVPIVPAELKHGLRTVKGAVVIPVLFHRKAAVWFKKAPEDPFTGNFGRLGFVFAAQREANDSGADHASTAITILPAQCVDESPLLGVERAADVLHGFISPSLGHVEFGIAGRAKEHQLPRSHRQVGIIHSIRVHIAPTPALVGISLGAHLLLACVFECFENSLPNPFVPFGTGHSINFAKHHAGNSMVVIAGKRAIFAVRDANDLAADPSVGHAVAPTR